MDNLNYDIKVNNVMNGIRKDLINPFKNHYNPCKIMKQGTSYSMIISKRTDGKSFAFRLLIYYAWQKFGYVSAYIRRMESEIKPSEIAKDYDKIFEIFPQINFKKYDGINLYRGGFRGYWVDDKGKRKYDKTFVEYCSINCAENIKSTKDIQNLFLIVFDEFMSRDRYLPNEFIRFSNLLSTLIRETLDCRVVMLGNPVNWNCPYFNEYGIKNIKEIKENTIQVFKGEKVQTSIAVERCGSLNSNKKINTVNDRFFGFDNNQIKSITTGIWETPLYPRLKLLPCEQIILQNLFISLENYTIRVKLCYDDSIGFFVRCVPTDVIEFYNDDIVFDVTDIVPHRNNTFTRYSQFNRYAKLEQRLYYLYNQNRFFYSDNTVGDNVRYFYQKYLTSEKRYM